MLHDEGRSCREGAQVARLPQEATGIGSPREIGFALFVFDPVDLFSLSEIRIVKFLSKRVSVSI